MRIGLSAALALVLASGLAARTKTDVVVMANGDRFTCEIKRLERGVLFASFDYVDGTVSIQWSKVARLESGQLFIVHVQDGSIYEGKLRTPDSLSQQPVHIEVFEPPTNPTLLERASVVELAPTAESIWRRLSGNIDTGLIYTKGNDNTQFNVGAELRVRGEHWRMSATYFSNFSKSSGAEASTRNQTRIWSRRLIGGKRAWYYSGAAEFLQSSQQGINLQTILGGGMGRFIRDTNSTRIALTADLAFQQTRYRPSVGTQSPPNALAAMFVGDLHLFKFKKTSFDATASLMPVLTESGRVRSNVNTAYSIQIINNLWFKISFFGNWDNRPPSHFSGSDYGTSSSISYSFN